MATDTISAENRLWPRSTSLFLLLVGVVLSVGSFTVVLNMPELSWETLREDALRSSYQSRGELVVPSGEHPGVYIIAELMGSITQSSSPYPGLALVMAVVVALPLIWLPTSVARIFKRARAGYALILLPAVMWLLNQGTILVGTQYGLSDMVSPLRVHALYGLPASFVFLSLALLVHLSTFRLRAPALLAASLAVAILAAASNLLLGLSGLGVAAAVGVLWWANVAGRRRWLFAIVAMAVAVCISYGAQAVGDATIARGPAPATGTTSEILPGSGGAWEQLYRGLTMPEAIASAPSPLGVAKSVDAVDEAAAAVDPEAQTGTVELEAIVRDLYTEAVTAQPFEAIGLYVAKGLYVIKQFGAMIAFVIVAVVIALMRRSRQRRSMGVAVFIALPTLMIGIARPVLSSPDLYHFTETAAALGILVTISLGALVWSLTSMPSHVRAMERSRLSGRLPALLSPHDERSHTSVIVPTRNGEDVIEETIRALAGRLRGGDEIIVVENGSSDGTTQTLDRIAAEWSSACDLVVLHSGAGLGEALRTGVLASTGQWLLLTADDLPFGFTDFDQFDRLPMGTVVAIGSKAHPESTVNRSRRRAIQSKIFRFLRAALLQSNVGDSQGTIWVDGAWARAFGMVSRETGLMWTTELVLAAEQQGIRVLEVPVTLSGAHESGLSRFRITDAWHSVVGFTRLAVYKDDYVNEAWTRTPAAPQQSAPLP